MSDDYLMTQQFQTNLAGYDLKNLAALKRQASADNDQSNRQIAQQFEGLFVQMMLKNMRSALPKGGLFDSSQVQLYTSLLDQQLAQQTATQGIGLADMLVKQMTRGNQVVPNAEGSSMDLTVANSANPLPLDDELIRQVFSTDKQNGPQGSLGQLLHFAPTPRNRVERLTTEQLQQQGVGPNVAFIQQLLGPVLLASEQSGIPHQLILAQAALESGWGKNEIKLENGKNSYNLFGIKAGAGWQGASTEITTTEYIDNNPTQVKDKFRVYSSYYESIQDYISFISQNKRYSEVGKQHSAEQAAVAIHKAGYATDPNYANKLIGLIQHINQISQSLLPTSRSAARANTLDNLF